MSKLNTLLYETMKRYIPEHLHAKVPPPCFLYMDGEFLDFVPKTSLTARFPVKEAYQNPMGYMQGGFITAAIDNTLGPLGYLIAPPSVTIQLNTSYMRPVTPKDMYIVVRGEVVAQTKTQLFLDAKVANEAGKLIATATANCKII